jgi:hypothetical protein
MIYTKTISEYIFLKTQMSGVGSVVNISAHLSENVMKSFADGSLQKSYDKAVESNNLRSENMILYKIIEDLVEQLEHKDVVGDSVQKNVQDKQSQSQSYMTLQNKHQDLQQQYNKQSLVVGSLRKEIEQLKSNVRSHEMSPDAQKVRGLEEKIKTLEDELKPLRVQKIKLGEARKKNQQLERLLRVAGL